MNEEMNERMLDLLTRKAIYGLNADEERELTELQKQSGSEDESFSFELTAAALSMADLDNGEPMPASLQSRIAADADKYFAAQEVEMYSAPASAVASETATQGSLFNWLGWAFAATACIALAFNLYYTRQQPPLVQVPPTPTPEEKLTPAQMRQRLIESAPDLARGSWGAGNVREVVPAGDIVWSDAKQAGYMRLSGLPKNDPNLKTYQLWIFDETQSDKTPIDGGTFDVNADGEVIIPINAKLRPRNTKMYAITVEKAGGVVVSDRKEIVALAKRET